MANELIQVKLGFDSREFETGTKAAKKQADTLKDTLGPINEQISKIGLSFVAPLAMIGKVSMAAWEMGKTWGESTDQMEQAMYRLTQTTEGLGDSITKQVGRGIGALASFGEAWGKALSWQYNKTLELIGLQEKGTQDRLAAIEKENAASEYWNNRQKKALQEIADLEKKLVNLQESKRPIADQLADSIQRYNAAQKIVETSTQRTDEFLKAQADTLKESIKIIELTSKLEAENLKLTKEQADAKAKALKDDAEAAKWIDELIGGTKKAVLEEQKIAKEKQAAADAEEEKAKNAYYTAAAVADQEYTEKRIIERLREQSAEMQNQIKYKSTITRIGSAYSSQDDYELTKVRETLLAQMADIKAKNVGSTAPDWVNRMMLAPYTTEIEAITKELNSRAMEREMQAEKTAWEEARGITEREKQMSLSERMTQAVEEMNQRLAANGFSTTKGGG